MSDKFDNLQQATLRCIEQHGGSSDEELFEFRNAATYSIIHDLLREYDHLIEQAGAPIATHSLGTLTAAETALIQAHRHADEHGKRLIRIAVDAAVQGAENRQAKESCKVVDLAAVRKSQS